MLENTVKLRVRYSETDQMGVVYHGNYLPYFEVGRVEWLRNQGVSYKSLEEDGIGLPIVNININYKAPAKYDDELTVVTRFKSQESVKIEFECSIFNEEGKLLTTADFLLVFVDMKTGKPVLPSGRIKEIIDKCKEML